MSQEAMIGSERARGAAGPPTPGEPDVMVIKPRNSLARLGLPQLWEYRHLLRFFVLRALRARYRPTMLGYGWIIVRPALMCLVYVVVFSGLFGIHAGPIPFAVFALLGILVFLFFANGVNEIAASLFGNAGIMSKVYYPRLVVPLTSLVTNLLDLAVGMALVALLMLVFQVMPSVNIWLAPAFLGGFVLWTSALGLVLAARSVTNRDILMALPVVMRVVIYTMPAVYPVTIIPERYQTIYYLNPMAAYLQGLRWSLWGDVAPPLWSIGLATALGIVLLIIGLRSFNHTESTMVDRL